MPSPRKFYRLTLFILLLIIGIPLTIIFLRKSLPPQSFSSLIASWWLGLAAKVFGVRIKTYGKPLTDKTLFVSNHISWLDILVIGKLVPVQFLSKHEVQNIPLFGWLATRAGTLYLHRGKHESASEAVIEITTALANNNNTLVFAEGTTTDGNIKKFHGRMLQSAIDARAAIQPVAIFYPKLNSTSGQIETNPAALFIGNTTAGESMHRVLAEASIDVEVHFLQPIDARDRTRYELAQHAYDEVVEAIAMIKQSRIKKSHAAAEH